MYRKKPNPSTTNICFVLYLFGGEGDKSKMQKAKRQGATGQAPGSPDTGDRARKEEPTAPQTMGAAEQKGEVARRGRFAVLVQFARRLRGRATGAVRLIRKKERMSGP